ANKPQRCPVSMPSPVAAKEGTMTERNNPDESNSVNLKRRRALQCMAWAGTGILWSVAGGVPRGFGLGGEALAAESGGFTFVQISDSHIGFKGEVNPNPGS